MFAFLGLGCRWLGLERWQRAHVWSQPCAGLGGSLCLQQDWELQLGRSCSEGRVELRPLLLCSGWGCVREGQLGWLRCDSEMWPQ